MRHSTQRFLAGTENLARHRTDSARARTGAWQCAGVREALRASARVGGILLAAYEGARI
jgi:hypothetical protein